MGARVELTIPLAADIGFVVRYPVDTPFVSQAQHSHR
jgi:hypothetical protein